MSIGDVYQIRAYQRFGTFVDDVLNVFYYQQRTGLAGDTAADLYSEFTDNVWDLVRALQIASMVTMRFTVLNINDPDDYFEATPASPGTNVTGGAALPTFISMAFRAPRIGAGRRYSYKRLAGQSTGMLEQGAGGQWADAQITFIEPLCVALGAVQEGVLGTYAPVQVAAGWQLNPPVAPVVNYDLTGTWAYNDFPSHQVTRQEAYYVWITPTP